jgi:hypothetical protein
MPSPRTKSNVPKAALRWTVERAGVEFGLSTGTLRKALGKNSAAPDADGLFSTRKVIDALYGSMAAEKLATQKQITERITLENQITCGQMLSRSELSKGLALIADAMSSRIMVSELSRLAKEDLLKDLSSIPLMLKEVAHAQSRLPRGNGTRPESEGEER